VARPAFGGIIVGIIVDEQWSARDVAMAAVWAATQWELSLYRSAVDVKVSTTRLAACVDATSGAIGDDPSAA
jgi:hypothetical protein